MSVFPITLPLYPMLNASDAMERLLEKDAEAAKALPSEEKADAEKAEADSGPVDSGRPANRITAIEGTAEVVATSLARSGAEQFVQAEPVEASEEAAASPQAAEGYQAQSDAVRSDDETVALAEVKEADDNTSSPRLDKRT